MYVEKLRGWRWWKYLKKADEEDKGRKEEIKRAKNRYDEMEKKPGNENC